MAGETEQAVELILMLAEVVTVQFFSLFLMKIYICDLFFKGHLQELIGLELKAIRQTGK